MRKAIVLCWIPLERLFPTGLSDESHGPHCVYSPKGRKVSTDRLAQQQINRRN